jgi:hypothetical protein
LVEELLPPIVTGIDVARSQFPKLVLAGIGLRDVVASGCDVDTLALEDAQIAESRFEECQIRRIVLRSEVVLSDSLLDIECLEGMDSAETGRLSIFGCQISQSMREAIDGAFVGREHLVTERNVQVLSPDEDTAGRTKGRRFLDKLVQLVRKDGREDWGIYIHKLRGKTVVTDATFDGVLAVLQNHGIAFRDGDMVRLTAKAEAGLYDGKGRPGRAGFDRFREMWEPVVNDLDAVLEPGGK